MKLELKHIVGYLPYKIKGSVLWEHKAKLFNVELYGIIKDYLQIENPFGGTDYCDITEFTPILRPLSDIGSSKFYKLWDKETDMESILQFIESDFETRKKYKFSLEFWESLYKHYFDIGDLIEKGLAIDINTLKI